MSFGAAAVFFLASKRPTKGRLPFDWCVKRCQNVGFMIGPRRRDDCKLTYYKRIFKKCKGLNATGW